MIIPTCQEFWRTHSACDREPSQVIAMLVQALIERQIRTAMAERGIRRLLVYPEDRGSAAPTAARVLDVFTPLARHDLIDQHGRHVQTFRPELDPLNAKSSTSSASPTPPTSPRKRGTEKPSRKCGNSDSVAHHP